MKRLSAWVACIALITATVGVGTPALAAKAKPKITKAEMQDRDGNGIADAVFLTYSRKVKHPKDGDGKYPFTVEGYEIVNVGKAQGRLLIINLMEDITAPSAPSVSYKPTKKDPVKAARGKKKRQAKKQTFNNVTPFTPLPTNHLTVIIEGAGSVTSVPPGIACPAVSCEGDFTEGSPVALAAVADVLSGTTFVGWEGDCTDSEPLCQLTMDGTSKTVTAVFTAVVE